MRSKRGQTEVATLIAIIAVFMLIYLLLLPPDERRSLLGINTTTEDNDSDNTTSSDTKTLLSELPGLVSPSTKDEVEHTIASVNLITRTDTKIETLANKLEVSRSIFTSSIQEVPFKTDDLDSLDKVNLFFSVGGGSSGSLMIKVNNRIVYKGVANGAVAVEIRKDYLNKDNVISFDVSSPGLNLFGKNVYTLNELKLKQEFKLAALSAKRTFEIPATEKNNIKTSVLEGYISCNPDEADILEIKLNDDIIFSDIPNCDNEFSQEISISNLLTGKNTFEFESTKGSYQVNVGVKNTLKEKILPIYSFTLTKREISSIESGDRDVQFEARFGEGVKQVKFLVNGNELDLDTTSESYIKTISEFVEEGTNTVEIRPRNEFEIISLKIKLV